MRFLAVWSHTLAWVAIYKRITKGSFKLLRVLDKEDLAEGDIGVYPPSE
jgi:hypothetical protein